MPLLRCLAIGLLVALLALAPGSVSAAELLQVRGANLLQVGDSNRSYTVELACMQPLEGERDQAVAWLRRQLPRHSRVNLRPIGNRDGILLARVTRLGEDRDLSQGLIAAGFAESRSLPSACG